MPSQSTAERFWARVDKSGDCWVWTGPVNGSGYGSLTVRGPRRPWMAHRYAYHIAVGPIPSGLNVLHRCDNRRCVRPDHLWVGTQSDNMRDCVSKGRDRPELKGQSGETNSKAKLTWVVVREIRSRIPNAKGRGPDQGMSALARELGVSHITISQIVRHRTWREEGGDAQCLP